MKIVFILPIYATDAQMTHECLTSIFKYAKDNPSFTVLAINDGSPSKRLKHCLKSYPIKVLNNWKNKGYMYSTNRGIRYALDKLKADWLVLMNNDIEVYGDWLARMLKQAHKYDVMGYSGRMAMGKAKHKKGYMLEYSCTLIKREVFEKIGILDTRFGRTAYYSDDDFCLRALTNGFQVGQFSRKGEREPVTHHGAQTNTEEKATRDMKKANPLFFEKWKPHMDNKIVKTYLTMYTFDPWKWTWGDKERRNKRAEKKTKKKVKRKKIKR